ncbi:putative WRKY transcription factor 61 [Cocos nucifera]|uniref:Putative WRKY transcription factor 61 n=1 Tax=Cocos nucifera TaxID=13894 RepID=A0A8K0NB91_COCNU|nr:putative WRKY transcription factor 61 [Cocos nucifera]
MEKFHQEDGRKGDLGWSLMEVMLKRNVAVKEETDVKYVGDEERTGEIGKFGSEMPACDRDSSRSPSPSRKDSSNSKQDNQLESIKEEMGEVRKENERLKAFLAQMVKDYQSLKLHFFGIVQKDHFKKPAETSSTLGDVEEPELVSLSLGASASRNRNHDEEEKRKENERINEGLTLGLHYKIDGSTSSRSEPPANLSPDNSFEGPKKEDAGEPWPPSETILESSRNGEDEVLPQPPVKKARVSVRARCDAPTVQRCAEDMSILITTYEGTHNHPLPMSATAMASTTSAAASMLTSGSSTSRPAFGSPAASTTTSANLHGLSLLDNSRVLEQFYPPNPSIHCSPYHSTITIDLTAPSSTPPVYFSSNTAMPSSWGHNVYSSYGAQSYNKIHTAGSLNLGRQAQDSFFLSHLQKATSPTHPGGQRYLTDTIAKAITSDPSFKSALAAAITSINNSCMSRSRCCWCSGSSSLSATGPVAVAWLTIAAVGAAVAGGMAAEKEKSSDFAYHRKSSLSSYEVVKYLKKDVRTTKQAFQDQNQYKIYAANCYGFHEDPLLHNSIISNMRTCSLPWNCD